ncbi:MAG: PIG-L family deacetylase [Planctomycetes bacterium]|nr:PIG-L family deacetylase [Planctomycetota bacterium]
MTDSRVEGHAIGSSACDFLRAPDEKIGTVVVDHFPALGKLTALRFLEWIQENPEGVISLPTGKTPEHFIKQVKFYLEHWQDPSVRADLESHGIDSIHRPALRGLRFVQIDEFYPINPTQHNSFHYFVNKYYIDGFGLDRNRALLIDGSTIGLHPGEILREVWPDDCVDLSLRYRSAKSLPAERQQQVIMNIDQWCQDYEEGIRAFGGIGFFLGGIGPDGHIGFNIRGSDPHSTTRLTATNYETQAAAAGDLGGIEISRRRLVITIGLGTITFNPACVAIIMAAGEAKSGIVADAISGPGGITTPATSLRKLPHARFFLTRGAARKLRDRSLAVAEGLPHFSDDHVEKALVDLALARKMPLDELKEEDLTSDPAAAQVLRKRPEGAAELLHLTRERLHFKLAEGMKSRENTRFFHTEPHHDDLMLGCLPAIVRMVRSATNVHYFACLTSGFTAVTNSYMAEQLHLLLNFLGSEACRLLSEEGYFTGRAAQARQRDVWQFLDGVAAANPTMRDEGSCRRLLRNLMEIFDEDKLAIIVNRAKELLHYFETQYPGKKDTEHIQRMKGMCREWEAECLWGHVGWNCEHVMHLRLKFYSGEIFTEEPTIEQDAQPILAALEKTRPDVVTVAFDPEGSGPDTHYKVLQAMAEALKLYRASSGREDIEVWGYRNVWYDFHPSEADIFVPVSLNMFALMDYAFLNTFGSQRSASFPSHEHEGPFCELAQKIQVRQYQMIKTCLGRDWFHQHSSALVRASRGLVFLKKMNLEEFFAHSRKLRQRAENR